jgi:hypothetical protein
MLGRYRRLQRDLSRREVDLLGMEARIVAMETFLQTTREQQQNPEQMDGIRNELATHREAIRRYREEIQELERLIEAARIQVGVGDARHQRDDRLREEYNRLVERERQLMPRSARTAEIDRLLGRVIAVESQLDNHDARIDEVVEERITDMRRVIEEESGNLDGYRERLAVLETETEEVVGAITYENFQNVRQRFYDLVLRSDVGRIDVAWQRREEHRMRVDLLTRERTRELQALDDEFREIMDESRPEEVSEEGGGPTEEAPPPEEEQQPEEQPEEGGEP